MTAPSQMMNCDFCSVPYPARMYRTAGGGTVQVRAYRESGPIFLEQNFAPEWEACERWVALR